MPKHANKIERNILMKMLDYILFIYSVCMCMHVHVCMYTCSQHAKAHVEIRGEFLGVSSFFPLYRYVSVSRIELWSSAGLEEIPFTH